MPVLLITGAGRGIGAATARLAAERGYDVAVNYKSDDASAAEVVAAVKAKGRKAVAIKADMGKEADIERVFDETAKALGPVTHVVHSSGITGGSSRLDEASAETIRATFEVNSIGALLCLRAAIRRMSTKHGGKGGAIVMLSSMAAILGSAGEYVWYAASKGAVDTMVVGAAREVVREGIRINAVSPGMIDTDIHPPGRLDRFTPMIPAGRPGTADEVAEAILYLLSDAAAYVVGANLRVSGGR